jgi:hypothetical protein
LLWPRHTSELPQIRWQHASCEIASSDHGQVKPFKHPVSVGLTEIYISVTRKPWAYSKATTYKTTHTTKSAIQIHRILTCEMYYFTGLQISVPVISKLN